MGVLYEKGVVFRFGRLLPDIRGPGLRAIRPIGDRMRKVTVKDIALPESMMRSMSKQAEAERERRARVIAADGEFQVSQRLTDAAATMAETPGALQLRLRQTVVDVSAEKNSTLVMPFPVEMLRFFEHQSRDGDAETARRSGTRFALRGSGSGALPRPAIPAQPSTGERRDNRPARADAEESPARS